MHIMLKFIVEVVLDVHERGYTAIWRNIKIYTFSYMFLSSGTSEAFRLFLVHF